MNKQTSNSMEDERFNFLFGPLIRPCIVCCLDIIVNKWGQQTCRKLLQIISVVFY